MKGLLVTLEYEPFAGGIARYYSSLVAAFAAPVEVWVPPLSQRIWPAWLPLLWQLPHRARLAQASYIWVGHVLPLGTIAWLWRAWGGLPYIVSVHGLDILGPERVVRRRWLVGKILCHASLVVANSQFTARQLERYGVLASKITVITPAAGTLPEPSREELHAFRKTYRLNGAPLLLSVGRLVPRKGFDTLLQSLPALWEPYPAVHCMIIGQGAEEGKLRRLIGNLPKPDQVHLVTDSTDGALAAAYRTATIFALPARTIPGDAEGFGMVCLEAAQAGVPAVVTSSGGLSEAVLDGVTGLVVPPDNPLDFRVALLKLLGDPELRASLGAAARRYAQATSWPGQAAALYKAIIDAV